MQTISSPAEMQKTALALRQAGKRIGFVPTMGYLHEGHLSLVGLARRHADVVVLSIFVNPLQFGLREDFSRYPRDFERDRKLCETGGVDIIFNPAPEAMYAGDRTVLVDETRISKVLCGAARPGHFAGVLTVVAKLFNLVLPDVAVFGQKDAQQARLIVKLVEDLNFPLRIIIGPTVREPDGLAMSSRNTYLSSVERREALCLSQSLRLAKTLYQAGERKAGAIGARITDLIRGVTSARIDYVEIVDADTFQPVAALDKPAVIALAVQVGKTRLIDNLTLPDTGPSNL